MSEPGFREGLGLLKDRDFSRLFFAYLVSYFGTAMAPIAIAFGVLNLTGSTSSSALVIAASASGQIMMLLIGGTLADRTSRHKLIIGADLVALVSQLAMGYLLITGDATIINLAALMLITGMAYALHQPAMTGFIPQMVEPKQLQAANALLGTARNGSLTLGAASAGILVATVGAGPTLVIDGLSFGLSAVLIYTLKPKQQAETEDATFWEDLKEGWTEFISHKWLWTIVLQFSILVAALDAVFGLLGPAVARSHLGGPTAWGIISAGFGFGTMLGGLLAIRLRVQRPMLVASFMAFSFAINPLTLSVPLDVWMITLGAMIAGMAGQIFGVLWYTTLQTQIPSHLLSRVSAYDHLGTIGLAPMGIIVFGYLYENIGYRSTLWMCAACVIVPTLIILSVREVRELKASHLQA